jgi:hypothetical protein
MMSLDIKVVLGIPIPGDPESASQSPVAFVNASDQKNNSQEILVRDEGLCKVQKKSLKIENMRILGSWTVGNLVCPYKRKILKSINK